MLNITHFIQKTIGSKRKLIKERGGVRDLRVILLIKDQTIVHSVEESRKLKYIYLVFCPVNIDSSSMSKKQVVGNNVWLSSRIPCPAKQVKEDGASPWSEDANIIALSCHRVGLV